MKIIYYKNYSSFIQDVKQNL